MYYVYHIEGKKVGCTINPRERIENQQGYKTYTILAKTSCLNTASFLEIYYQKKYKYKIDKLNYKQLILKKMIHITRDTITLKKTSEKTLSGFEFPSFLEIDSDTINIDNTLIDWIKENNFKSQYNEERYVYKQSLLNFYNSSDKVIFDKIRDWAKNKGIFDKGDSKTQYIKLQEEAGELAKALLNKDREEIIDAIGDIVVVLTNLAHLENLKIEDCIDSAYNVIKDRQGKMHNGTFIKNK